MPLQPWLTACPWRGEFATGLLNFAGIPGLHWFSGMNRLCLSWRHTPRKKPKTKYEGQLVYLIVVGRLVCFRLYNAGILLSFFVFTFNFF